MKKKFFPFFIFFIVSNIFSQSFIESTSDVNWINKVFYSELSLDMKKSALELPAGKSTACGLIKLKTPSLLKDSILSLYVDSEKYIGDLVDNEDLSLEEISKIIENGKKTPEVFSDDGNFLNTKHTINMNTISKLLVKHKNPYTSEMPVETVSSRVYTGIIIDARGSVPVHGEYVSSEVYPCFFPKIWDENMNLIYEKNMVSKNIAENSGIADYNFEDDFSKYESKVGFDPLYIKASKVYGRNRTDPVISSEDALQILSRKENLELLKQGKVVILLDKKNLIYKVSLPEKNPSYYATYKTVKQYFYNEDSDIQVKDSLNGILFSVDLKFVPDSPRLLPGENTRIKRIAEMLLEIISDNSFTILVEGHTADLGKPVGQMNLSIERTRTVMNELILEGVPESLFTYKGYGATKPVATNETEEGRAQNRRVDITARPRATYIQRDWK